MNRIVYMVLRHLPIVPYWFWKIDHMGKRPDQYPEQERYDYLRNIIKTINQNGRVTVRGYGEEQLPSSPESALVHMVDAVVIRLEAMEQNVGQSVWNRDIVIYQTVNDFSSSEIYDHSGMSMNQFLKIREFLAKEELLR